MSYMVRDCAQCETAFTTRARWQAHTTNILCPGCEAARLARLRANTPRLTVKDVGVTALRVAVIAALVVVALVVLVNVVDTPGACNPDSDYMCEPIWP